MGGRKYNWLTAFVAILVVVGWEAPRVAASQVIGTSKSANKAAAPQKGSQKGQRSAERRRLGGGGQGSIRESDERYKARGALRIPPSP